MLFIGKVVTRSSAHEEETRPSREEKSIFSKKATGSAPTPNVEIRTSQSEMSAIYVTPSNQRKLQSPRVVVLAVHPEEENQGLDPGRDPGLTLDSLGENTPVIIQIGMSHWLILHLIILIIDKLTNSTISNLKMETGNAKSVIM